MEIDLTPELKRILILCVQNEIDRERLLSTHKDALEHFCNLLQYCDDVGTTLHVN